MRVLQEVFNAMFDKQTFNKLYFTFSKDLHSVPSEDNLEEKTENVEMMTYSNWQRNKNSATKEAMNRNKKKNTYTRPKTKYEI